MGNGNVLKTRNGREIGINTEFETRNRQKWETILYKKHHFPMGNEKIKRILARCDTISIIFNGKREKYKKYRHKKDAIQYDVEECDSRQFDHSLNAKNNIWK